MKSLHRIINVLVCVPIVCILSGCLPLQVMPPTPQAQAEAEKQLAQGVIALRKGDLTRARTLFEIAHELAPSAEAVDGIGCVLWEQEHYGEAERYFREAIAYNSEYAPAYAHLARVLEQYALQNKVQWSDVEELHKEAIRLNPLSGKIRNDYAVFLIERGYREEGRKELIKAQAVEDEQTIANNLRKLP